MILNCSRDICEGRTPDLSQDVLDKFTEFSLEQGILPENIAILPKNGKALLKTLF